MKWISGGCLRLKYDYSYFFPAILFIVYLFLSDRLLNSFFYLFHKGIFCGLLNGETSLTISPILLLLSKKLQKKMYRVE